MIPRSSSSRSFVHRIWLHRKGSKEVCTGECRVPVTDVVCPCLRLVGVSRQGLGDGSDHRDEHVRAGRLRCSVGPSRRLDVIFLSHVRYADGREETVHAREVYYWPPGHTVWVDEDYEAIEFSPSGQMGEVIDHLKAKLGS